MLLLCNPNTLPRVLLVERWCRHTQASALYHLPAFLAVVVHLAGQGWRLDDISAAAWPADASGSATRLASVVCRGKDMAPGSGAGTAGAAASVGADWQLHAQHRQQQPSLTCLSELLMAVVHEPSAADELPPCEAALFQRLAVVLATQGGVSPAGARSSSSSSGYSSPGLLHLLLGTHVRLLLEDAASKPGLALAQHRTVNALHLLRALLRQPGILADGSRHLLLPCIVRPLAQLLAAPPGGCAAAQFQVFRLLDELLLSQPTPQLLLSQHAADAAGGACSNPQ